MLRKIIKNTLLLSIPALLIGCSNGQEEVAENNNNSENETVLEIAALESSHLSQDMYAEVGALFEEKNPGVKVEFTVSANIEDEITPGMRSGSYPDIVILGQGREGLTESMYKSGQTEELSELLSITIPGEDVTVGDKIIDGMIGNINTNPFNNEEVFMFPLFYSPIGFVYDQSVLDSNNLETPTTLDEFLSLDNEIGDMSLYTFPAPGYFDHFFWTAYATFGGEEFYNDVITYKEDIWLSDTATEILEFIETLVTEYTHEATLANANPNDRTENELMVANNEALFMHNGSWIVTQLEDAPKHENFEWNMMPMPATDEGNTRYLATGIETAWIPSEADNIDLAKEFLAFSFSDEAVEIYSSYRQNPPVKGNVDNIYEPVRAFYELYEEEDIEALVGGYLSHEPIEGISLTATLYQNVLSIMSGDLTVEEWQEEINAVSNQINATLDQE